ncbi:MAG TPA: UDP-glucose/GDP-mannose dehydrogenase family protein [Pirellulales bacterium]|jgi:UDPglucose 6-dehydrogenase|nr:UDP-glucose/GDP-mannose dehydrogenase family protein [Pirellulales bacterium]
MRIAVIGTGYVGLVTGTCFSESGNEVTCVDIDQEKVERLSRGDVPIYEPGLAELVARNLEAQRLQFTTDLAATVKPAKLIFLAVGTPPSEDGSADLSALWKVVNAIAPHLRSDAIVVTKSTVPVGTAAKIAARLKELIGRDCDVASNPEFLKEGAALDDFQKPDRVVVGVRRPEVADVLRTLYAPYLRTEKPFLVMSPESSEMTKYVANALLATKISFINEMANLCERMQADIDDVRRGIGHDQRIGFAFLFPGVGYGGSCFPKDVLALSSMARQNYLLPQILDAVHEVNNRQKTVLGEKIERYFGGQLKGKTIAIWGLAFKPRTDDIRDAPALVLINRLLELGTRLQVHDPEAMPNVRAIYEDRLVYSELPLQALDGADCVAIVTEWGEFRNPDFDEMRRRLKQPVIFDGRNLYNSRQMKSLGFTYHCIGKPPIEAK